MRSIDISGSTYNNGKLIIVRKLPKIGKISLYECHCTECAKDPELNGQALYSIRKGELDRGNIPCACGPRVNWTSDQYKILLRRKLGDGVDVNVPAVCRAATKIECTCSVCLHTWHPVVSNVIHLDSGCPKCAGNAPLDETEVRFVLQNRGFDLHSVGPIRNKSKVTVSCQYGHTWTPVLSDVINGGCGCPECAGNKKISEDTAIETIAAVCNANGWKFNGWKTSWTGVATILNLSCSCGCSWNPWYSTIASGRTGCPKCSKSGFDPSSPGWVYVYRWDHPQLPPFLKYGITNYPDQRLKQQLSKTKHTPTKLHLIEFDIGSDAQLVERSIKNLYLPIGATKNAFADGWTETASVKSLNDIERCLSMHIERQ
ncbi:hypothetical protein AHP1_1561 [Aeromonas phage Ahp1_CNU-2021]|nr:hypothetical protein AHP1_1561 [Aeromonas phage Ahp1_CNU-2021]